MQDTITEIIAEIHLVEAKTIDPSKIDIVDSIARTICSANCEARGLSPCWSFDTHREDAMEWPNPFCDKPGCSKVAARIFKEIEGDLVHD